MFTYKKDLGIEVGGIKNGKKAFWNSAQAILRRRKDFGDLVGEGKRKQ